MCVFHQGVIYFQPLGLLEDYRYGRARCYICRSRWDYHLLLAACHRMVASEKADVALFMLSLFLFTFASSCCSFGCSAGVGGMEKLLRHARGQLFTRPAFSPFD